ncbi:MAG: protein phosphatase CheZ [Pseudomonadota bacterium]
MENGKLESAAEDFLSAVRTHGDQSLNEFVGSLLATHSAHSLKEIAQLAVDLRAAASASERCLILARDGIPGARADLNYVLEGSESATHRTLDALDVISDGLNALRTEMQDLKRSWTAQKKNPVELAGEPRDAFSLDLDRFVSSADRRCERLAQTTRLIVEAQGFQDLGGQVISRVLQLVDLLYEELESAMGELPADREPFPDAPTGGPPRRASESSAKTQDDVDALLSRFDL